MADDPPPYEEALKYPPLSYEVVEVANRIEMADVHPSYGPRMFKSEMSSSNSFKAQRGIVSSVVTSSDGTVTIQLNDPRPGSHEVRRNISSPRLYIQPPDPPSWPRETQTQSQNISTRTDAGLYVQLPDPPTCPTEPATRSQNISSTDVPRSRSDEQLKRSIFKRFSTSRLAYILKIRN